MKLNYSIEGIRRRHAAWATAEWDQGATYEHPDTECSADRDRAALLKLLDAAPSPALTREARRLREVLLAVMRRMDCQDLFDDAFNTLANYEHALRGTPPPAGLDALQLTEAGIVASLHDAITEALAEPYDRDRRVHRTIDRWLAALQPVPPPSSTREEPAP